MPIAEYDKWKAHVELHKFTGPTVKLLQLEPGLWAILDHEYNFIFVCPYDEIAWRVLEVQHPPQRERARPIIPYDEPKLAGVNLIETGDLDL